MRRPRYFGQLAGNWFLRDRNLIPEKNHMTDAAASAAPNINKRYLIQDGSTVAAATRSRSLVWFGSTTTFDAASVAFTFVGPGVPSAPSVFGETGQAVPAVATRLSPLLSSLRT